MVIYEIIEAMAFDLGIRQFNNESELQYYNRVLYSAMACWIKAAAMDRSIIDETANGVSRKHILERCARILEEMLLRYPQSSKWFKVENSDDPIKIIRQRLLQCGDLVNVGYETNIGLSEKRKVEVGKGLIQIIGSIIETGSYYSGIALVASDVSNEGDESTDDLVKNFKIFLQNAWWKSGSCVDTETEFFNAAKRTTNNYSCWEMKRPEVVENIILTRHQLNNQAYEYIIEKEEHGIVYYHKLDKFLQSRGEHRRIMFALRAIIQNQVTAKKSQSKDHVHLKLNSYLPDKERIILETYTWPYDTIVDKLKWDVPLTVWPLVQTALEGLCIKIVEEKHG